MGFTVFSVACLVAAACVGAFGYRTQHVVAPGVLMFDRTVQIRSPISGVLLRDYILAGRAVKRQEPLYAICRQDESQGCRKGDVVTVVAPVNGVVIGAHETSAQVTVGQVLTDIIPANAVLDAEIHVPSLTRSTIHLGQRISLSFGDCRDDACERQLATITSIAPMASIFLDDRDMRQQFRTEGAIFRIVAKLDEQYSITTGEKKWFRPGEVFQAELATTRRPLRTLFLSREAKQ